MAIVEGSRVATPRKRPINNSRYASRANIEDPMRSLPAGTPQQNDSSELSRTKQVIIDLLCVL